LRVDRGISQERLAELAELDRTDVNGIERGERNPSLANILKLAAAFGVNVSELARRAEALIDSPVGPKSASHVLRRGERLTRSGCVHAVPTSNAEPLSVAASVSILLSPCALQASPRWSSLPPWQQR
jgi:transcriptional regulator with XRE-family HTH domain